MATAPELTRNHIEVRGIGIINVASVFGIGSIRIEKRLDLVLTLKDWQDVEAGHLVGRGPGISRSLWGRRPPQEIPGGPGRSMAPPTAIPARAAKLKTRREDT